MDKPDCYQCKYRRPVPGDAHSRCVHPEVDNIQSVLIFLSSGYSPIGVTGDQYGVESGWFAWPINFDPVWLKTCDGFKERDGNE